MTKQQIDEIRERYEAAKWTLAWKDVNEVDLSLGDIPDLLDALEAAEKAMVVRDAIAISERDYWKNKAEESQRDYETSLDQIKNICFARDFWRGAAAIAESKIKHCHSEHARWKSRAEALERALKQNAISLCASCTFLSSQNIYHREKCDECELYANWQFDDSKYLGVNEA